MSHERAITIRRLSENDLHLAQGIDVSEEGQSVFRYINGELTTEPRKWHRPAWDAPQWEHKTTAWAQVHRWDVVIGAFDGATLIGMASLRYQLTETVAQLVSLHVSRAYRRHRVATRLLHELMRLARSEQCPGTVRIREPVGVSDRVLHQARLYAHRARQSTPLRLGARRHPHDPDAIA